MDVCNFDSCYYVGAIQSIPFIRKGCFVLLQNFNLFPSSNCCPCGNTAVKNVPNDREFMGLNLQSNIYLSCASGRKLLYVNVLVARRIKEWWNETLGDDPLTCPLSSLERSPSNWRQLCHGSIIRQEVRDNAPIFMLASEGSCKWKTNCQMKDKFSNESQIVKWKTNCLMKDNCL